MPKIAPSAPATTAIGIAESDSRPAKRPAARKTTANATGPTMRSTTMPSGPKPIMLMTKWTKPACTRTDAPSRHHSPLVVSGPKLAPQPIRPDGSEKAPPSVMKSQTTVITAAIAPVA